MVPSIVGSVQAQDKAGLCAIQTVGYSSSVMRVLFLSDFHGHLPDVAEWRPDLVIAGGDYCEVDEIRRLKFEAMGRGQHATQWNSLVGPGRAEELVDRALAEGAAVLSALATAGPPVLAIPGNSDRVGMYAPQLIGLHLPRPDRPEVNGQITNIENRVVSVAGVAFAGLGGWSGPHDPGRQSSDLEALRRERETNAGPLVLVSHNVPYASSLDGVNNPDLPAFAQGHMVGSRRCQAALEVLNPVVCLSGHLHENFGRSEQIGSSLCINGAGAYRGAGVLVEISADGQVSEPRFVHKRAGAPRILS